MRLTQASNISHDIDVDHVYAGLLLQCANGDVLLQDRDNRAGIENAGLITTFGGLAEGDEFEYEAAIREAREELGLDLKPEDLEHLCDIRKTERDGSSTRVSVWIVEGVEPRSIQVFEGRGFVRGTVRDLQQNPRLTYTCRRTLEIFELRQRASAPGETMTLEVVASVSSPAHPVNEDLFGVLGCSAWLIDGATPIDKSPKLHPISDARWLVELSDDLLRKYGPERPLPVALAQVLVAIRDRIASADTPLAYPPSAAIALIRAHNGVIEYLALSDVAVVVVDGDQVWLLDDQVSARREEHVLKIEREKGADAVRESMWHRRRHEMNRRGGYWVFSDEPESAMHVRHGYIEARPGTRVLIASDGFTRLVNVFGTTTWDQLAMLGPSDPEGLVSELRSLEDSDPDRTRYSRISTRDDATAVWLDVVS
ncbi:MAG: NUDIX domain-containing protein [Frankiaceae bacterium]|nr:NUDIX domain-containing protein [Frankiaceae bacterium]